MSKQTDGSQPHRFRISVKDLVAFSLQRGDLQASDGRTPTAEEGQQGHRWLAKRRQPPYQSEVSVKYLDLSENLYDDLPDNRSNALEITIAGRLDGMIKQAEPVFEEVKTHWRPLPELAASKQQSHWDQLWLYAWLVYQQQPFEACTLRLTYVDLGLWREQSLEQQVDRQALQQHYEQAIAPLRHWLQNWFYHRQQRDLSCTKLRFPFANFRPSQRQFAEAVYKAIATRTPLLSEAPTGIGKTISSLFPALLALPRYHYKQLIYATAKNSTQQHIEDNLSQLKTKQGLTLLNITLTAQTRLCLCDTSSSDCPYRLGYFDRIDEARHAALVSTNLGASQLKHIGRQFNVCPHALMRELVPWADLLVGDINYVYSPESRLDIVDKSVLLLDEAHNLALRSRDLFSQEVNLYAFRQHLKTLTKTQPDLVKPLKQAIRLLGRLQWTQLPEAINTLEKCCGEMTEQDPQPTLFEEAWQEDLWQLWRLLTRFKLLQQNPSWRDDFYLHSDRNRFYLQCLDAQQILAARHQACRNVVAFSATLQPMSYFEQQLGLVNGVQQQFPSPFLSEQMRVLHCPWIDTRYHQRQQSLPSLVDLCADVCRAQTGNYLVFFSSYEYMHKVHKLFVERYPEFDAPCQQAQMDDQQRADFIGHFSEPADKPTNADHPASRLGFAILGGLFGEGIDLPGQQLIGVIIAGTGIPAPDDERERLRERAQQQGQDGFFTAYRVPSIQRILQSAGRLIRSQHDKGVLILADQQLNSQQYRPYWPAHWQLNSVESRQQLQSQLSQFWQPNNHKI